MSSHVPTAAAYDPQDYPKFDEVADPRISPTRVPGEHFWIRLTDHDTHLSCLWCGQLREDTATCPGKPRLDILYAPYEPEVVKPITLPTPDPANAHVTTEYARVPTNY